MAPVAGSARSGTAVIRFPGHLGEPQRCDCRELQCLAEIIGRKVRAKLDMLAPFETVKLARGDSNQLCLVTLSSLNAAQAMRCRTINDRNKVLTRILP